MVGTLTGGSASNSGGVPSQSGGVLNQVAQYWPALNSALQKNQALAIANQSNAIDLGQKKAEASFMSGVAGGYDPPTGITWNGPSADPSKNPMAAGGMSSSPVATMMQDPLAQTMIRIDPKGTISTVLQRAFAPPTTYQVTTPDGQTRSQLMTPSQAVSLQSQGYQIAASEPAKPIDPNTALQTTTLPGSNNRDQTYVRQPGTTNFAPIGGPGKFVNPPQSDIGKLMADMSTFGGGQKLDGQQGSGAPGLNTPQITPPVSTINNQGGAGTIQQPPTAPQNAYPTPAGAISDPVAATDRNPIRRPWLQTPTSSAGSPAPNPGAVPTMADIVRAKMTEMARTPEQQAGLTKSSEIQATETQNKPIEATKAEAAFNNHLTELDMLRNNAQAVLDDPNSYKNFGKEGIFPNMPGGGAANAETKIDSVRNSSILNTMQLTKDLSPTGASGVRLLEREIPIFQNTIGNLSSKQSWETAQAQLQKIVDFSSHQKNIIREEFKNTYGRELNTPSDSSQGAPPGAPSATNAAGQKMYFYNGKWQ